MRITLSEPTLLRSLVQFLTFDQNVVVTALSDTGVEVGFIGSLNTWAQQRETELRLRSWMATHPDAVAVINL